MAIVIEGRTPCAICGDTDLRRPYTATSGVFFPEADALWRFCDAPLHLDCLAAWPHRARFSRAYFDMWREETRSGHGLVLAEGDAWLFRCGPARPENDPYYAETRLAEWPMVFKSRWTDWPRYVREHHADELSGDARRAAEQAFDQVRCLVPDLPSLTELRRQALAKLVT